MALRMKLKTAPFAAATEVDIKAEKFGNFVLVQGYRQPARLEWDWHVEQQRTVTGTLRNFIIFWDDEKTDRDGNAFSEANPIFEGFVEEMQPVASNKIHIVAYDATRKVANEVTVMSFAWQKGDVSENILPVPSNGTYPRLVFNATIDVDDDYSWQRAERQTMGQMIKTILEDQYHPLYWALAAPGDGTDDGGGTAYVASDLDDFDFEPQEKIVFESENVVSAIERLMQWEPEYRMVFQFGQNKRKWRFTKITEGKPVTLTLNSYNVADPAVNEVLSLDLTRSLEGRYGAVHIYGPERIALHSVYLSDGSLTDRNDGERLLQNSFTSCCDVTGQRIWQITDPDKRRVSRLLPEEIIVPTLGGQWGTTEGGVTGELIVWVPTRFASFQARWNKTSAGGDHWIAITGWTVNHDTGVIQFPEGKYLYRFNPNPAPGQPHYENPVDVRFIYGTYITPLIARCPSSGFAGTAYELANLNNVLRLYDEMMAVDYLRGVPITTEERVEEFRKLACRIHGQRKDIAYVGTCVLNGLDWEWHMLQRTVNFTGKDADGATVITGWEDIRAIVTEVEWDFENQLTTLTFSSDQADLIGVDIETEKRKAKIRAMSPGTIFSVQAFFETSRKFTEWGTPFLGQDITVRIDGPRRVYVDPTTGRIDASRIIG